MKPLSPKDPKTIGDFTLIGRLGAGGMGVVYLASRKSESVALKVIRESLIDDEVEAARFTREVVTLEKIQSPNVAEIIEAGVDDGRPWFAVEFVNGPNLSELVDDKGPLPLEKWWELATGVLRGLVDVHQMGIIHRDVKPANVIMAATGPKLIDFGIAHVSDATSVTATGLVAGSPAWFSPEQIEGLELSTATDVFSAGSLLTFAATGSSPWGGATTMTKASVFKILTSEPDMEGLDTEQSYLVSKMLEKEPAQRATAESLLENLDAIKAGKKVELKTASAAPKPKGTDATTTVERASLDQSVRAAYQADAGKAVTGRQDASASSSGVPNKRRNWTAVGAIVVVAALGIFFIGLNSSSSGAVSVSRIVLTENPAVGDYGLRLSSGSAEPVSIDFTEKRAFTKVFSWRTGEPLRFSYTPPFSEDESYEGTVLPADLGLNGFADGRELFIHVSLEETSTLISFRTGGVRAADEVYAVRLARGNEADASSVCMKELWDDVKAETADYTGLYDDYAVSKERARVDDATGIYWSTYAARVANLIAYMKSDLQSAEEGLPQLSPASQPLVESVSEAHAKLSEAWSNMRSISLRESASEWDSAWSEINLAESSLSRSSSSLNQPYLGSPEVTETVNLTCAELVQ